MRNFFTAAFLAALVACQQSPSPEVNQPESFNQISDAAPVDAGEDGPATDVVVRQSIFTPLDEASCKLIEENREEGPYWRRRCAGAAGYSVEWTESDLRQGLELASKDGRRENLRLSEVVAKGAFNRLGPRIEWRSGTQSEVDTVMVRVFVADGDQPTKPDRSLLAVARLKPTACVIAIVPPGSHQNDEARRIADAPSRPCLADD